MASPDITQYVDLDLVDRDPQDVYDIAVQHLVTTYPDFQPREGQMEIVLLEAVALEVAESIFAINRLPDAITEVLLSFFNIVRDIGQQPTADLTFTIAGGQGATVPAGSRFTLDIGNGLDPLVLVTDNELAIPIGSSTGTMSATATTYTDMFNGTPAGTLVQPQESLIYLDYVHLGSDVTDGRDPETDQEYLTRGVQRMARLSSTLTVPRQFQLAASEYVYVSRAMALDAYDPDLDPNNNGPVGQDPGFMTVAVYGDNEMVSAEHKAEILADFESECNANLVVKIIDPTITTVNIAVEVAIEAEADPADVVAAITTELETAINPMNWEWGSVVRRSNLLSIITNVPGVDYVSNLSTPASDMPLNGVAPLAELGTLTISTV